MRKLSTEHTVSNSVIAIIFFSVHLLLYNNEYCKVNTVKYCKVKVFKI